MKKVIKTDQAPPALGAYSQAIQKKDMLFVSGQLAIDPQTGKLIEGGVEAQTRRVLDNVKAIVEAAGLTMDDVVKATVFLDDIKDFKAMNGVYQEYFTLHPPARAAVEVANLPLAGGLVEIEVIAMR